MATYVGLLRGVNVGGRNKVSMADLRSLVESLGHTDVTTYIQSGNIVFTSAKAVAAPTLEAAIKDELGLDVTVVLRTPAELAKVVKANPFAREDLSKVHVGFMAAEAREGGGREDRRGARSSPRSSRCSARSCTSICRTGWVAPSCPTFSVAS